MAYIQWKGIEESVFHTISFMVEEVEVVQSRNANNFCALPVTWAGCLLCGWVGTRQGPLGRRLLPTDKCEQVVLRTTLCHSLKAPCAVRTRAWLIVTNLGGEEYITIPLVFHFLAASKKMSNFPSEDTSFSSVLWMKVSSKSLFWICHTLFPKSFSLILSRALFQSVLS